MNLIFEGCDKVGKTSLLKEFVKRRKFFYGEDWPVIKFSGPVLTKQILKFWRGVTNNVPIMQAEMMSEYLTTFKIFKSAKLDHIICDRFFLGEFVYCFLRRYRYEDEETNYWIGLFNQLMEETNCVLVYVKADIDVILKRMLADGGDAYTPTEAVEKILAFYEELLPKLNGRVVIIDTTVASVSYACDELEAAVASWE